MKFFTTIIIDTLIFLAISGFFPASFFVSSIWIAIIAAFVLAILNVLVKPILSLLSLPINFLTFGLFSIVINGFMLELTSFLVGSGFRFSSFWMAMLVAIIMSVVSTIITNNSTND
ncbi:phage holin family protein [Lentilactobacillus laojiaonis]|uniref:phage holin family protein n=1 Tax=Lentilactobacillus laojiaonis TaxID=2883998 RepID=UPI001D09DD33|nr:phage holin family protein [Lentilactobacillus laojiaonis]UDM31828.1 phage holin family protein [Lentilactobacillus laojiaonis]